MATHTDRRSRSTKALSKHRLDPHDTLATPEGVAIPVWQSGAGDPVAHLASVFDQLPGRPKDSRTD
jgi:hypothetical protein